MEGIVGLLAAKFENLGCEDREGDRVDLVDGSLMEEGSYLPRDL